MSEHAIHLVRLEAEGVTRATVRIFEAAEEAAENLRHAAAAAHDVATADAFTNADPDTLAARAERLRGAALHVLAVTADIARCAGRLEQLAALRRSEVPD
jgi:hypothetical protein